MESTRISLFKQSRVVFALTALGAVTAMVAVLLVASAGVAKAPTRESASVELPPEWRMEPKLLNFDHMFRKSAPSYEQSDWIRDRSRR